MNQVPSELLQEIMMFSVDYKSFDETRQSLSRLRSVSKCWLSTAASVIPRISKLIELDLETPIKYLYRKEYSKYWRGSAYSFSYNQLCTSNYFITFRSASIKIYHKSLDSIPYLYDISDVLDMQRIVSVTETSIGLMFELVADNSHSFLILSLGNEKTVRVTKSDIVPTYSDADLKNLYVLYHCLLITRKNDERLLIDHKTKTQILMPKCNGLQVISCGRYSLLWIYPTHLGPDYLLNITTNECLMEGIGKIELGNNFTDDAIVINSRIYHLPSKSFISEKVIRYDKILSLYKENNRYYVILLE